jgi:hypothetical protein
MCSVLVIASAHGHAQKICFVSTMASDYLIGRFLEIRTLGVTTNYPICDMFERAHPFSVDKII